MQDTVAVALITALSTLAAAALTGLVGALSTRRQLAHQLTVAGQESAERRATRRDELRREAYVGFLSACDRAYRQLDRRWLEAAKSEPTSGYDEAYTAMRAVDEAYNLVLLEGPADVAAAARSVLASLTTEYADQRRLGDEPGDAAAPLRDRHRDRWLAAIEVRTNRRIVFVDVVRPVLDRDG
ncbi:hypothetical protein F8271_11615 [Micromonospora sp. ALFpr18c]|uniref:hypothetical protein n=1 Tax=unclassified Micromonospora TaxID=2617518 RepID=UPI00124BA18B|nr:hypothetical protein [Micromonospora sp. ALFpr18c]KAB1942664.1 hypothetical protein F8271_11615 [Micromonospora sp. ALFpr18c]